MVDMENWGKDKVRHGNTSPTGEGVLIKLTGKRCY